MIISVDELKEFITTNKSDKWLEFNLLALETSIRKYTNNNFQNINVRYRTNAINGNLDLTSNLLKVGDTIQISQSKYNNGVYTIKAIEKPIVNKAIPLNDYIDKLYINKDLSDEEIKVIVKRCVATANSENFLPCIIDKEGRLFVITIENEIVQFIMIAFDNEYQQDIIVQLYKSGEGYKNTNDYLEINDTNRLYQKIIEEAPTTLNMAVEASEILKDWLYVIGESNDSYMVLDRPLIDERTESPQGFCHIVYSLARRPLALAFSNHSGTIVFRNLSFALRSFSISRPMYSCAFSFVEISGIGTSAV